MENAHPRPWTIGTGFDGHQTAVIDADGIIVADVEQPDARHDPRAEDSARLIVAAVNYLDREARELEKSLDAMFEAEQRRLEQFARVLDVAAGSPRRE